MKTGPQRNRRAEIRVVRDFEFQHHDRDDDGDEAVAEASSRFLPIAAPLADPSIFVDQPFLVTHLLVEGRQWRPLSRNA